MNVAIVGCGLIGQKRATTLGLSRLTVCADNELPRAEQLAGRYAGCAATADWRDAVTRPDVSLAIVATHHDSLAEITRCAIEAGKHVLVEKPAGSWLCRKVCLCVSASTIGTTGRFGRPGSSWIPGRSDH